MNRKRVAVLGGAGFLGSHLCERLLADGAASVVSLDNLITGSEANLRDLLGNGRLPPRGAGHLRAVRRGRPARLRLQPRLAGLAHRLRAAAAGDDAGGLAGHRARARAGPAARARSSSRPPPRRSTAIRSSIPSRSRTGGNVNPIGPRSVYDEAKRYGEALVAGVPAHPRPARPRIARIFNTYGPRMRLDDGRVVPAFVAQALAGEDFTVFGDGSQTRSFCYVADLVDGFVRLALSDEQDPVNLGNPEEMTILQFAEAVRAAAGGGGRIVHRPLPKDDPQRRRPDITPRPGVAGLGAHASPRPRDSGRPSPISAVTGAAAGPRVKVLVTGGAGFIGSHVADAFVDAGPRGVGARRPLQRQAREPRPEVRLVVADIRSPEAARLIETRALRGDVPPRGADGRAALGGRPALRRRGERRRVPQPARGGAARRASARSSSAPPAGRSTASRTSSRRPSRTPRGRSRPTASPRPPASCTWATTGRSTAWPRSPSATPTSTARGRIPHGEAGVVAIFSERLLRGEACTINGTGGQTRDFVYGPDVARANLLAAERDVRGPDQHRHRRGDRREPALCAPGEGGGHGPARAARPGEARRADAQLGGPGPGRRGPRLATDGGARGRAPAHRRLVPRPISPEGVAPRVPGPRRWRPGSRGC